MAVTLGDSGYVLARLYGFPGSRKEWNAMQAHQRAIYERHLRRNRAQRLTATMKRRRKSAGASEPSIGRERPAWQRGGRLPRRVVAVLENPRVRGQIP